MNDLIGSRIRMDHYEILSYYITLLKNVSNKINLETVRLMFNEVVIVQFISMSQL